MGSRRAYGAAQVYDGSKAGWKEDDACEPVNAYGASKLEAEQFLQASALLHPPVMKSYACMSSQFANLPLKIPFGGSRHGQGWCAWAA